MDLITLLGLTAAFCTTFALVPQVIKTYKTKDTRGLSLHMYIISTTGIFLWLVYGFLTSDLPLISANLITIILMSSILVMKIKHG